MFRCVDKTKIVASGGSLFQVYREQRSQQAALGIIEEGSLLVGGDRVDGTKCKAKQTIGTSIRLELRANRLSALNCLAGRCSFANGNAIRVHVA